MPSALLESYLTRIEVEGPLAADLQTLRKLHAAHVAAIPFENLDILLGRGISLDLEHLHGKLIARRRGGYCFEHNTLLLAVLRQIGFSVVPMEARVRAGSRAVRPRTHMVLVVEIDGEEWLADAGFGGEGPCGPVPLHGGVSTQPPGLSYRIVRESRLFVLQMLSEHEWADQYAWLGAPALAVDFEVANWFTSTHPGSPFVRTLTAQRATPQVRSVLRFPAYTEITETGRRTREIHRHELLSLLRDGFQIDLPDGTLFPAIDAARVQLPDSEQPA